MPALFEQLHQDHINYSRLLNLLELHLQKLEAGEKPDYLILQDILKYMINYPDMLHHPTEELLFEEVQEPDKKDSATIETLCEEHALLNDLAQRLENQLHNASSGHVVSKDEILKLGRQYIEILRQHIIREEREIFPLLEASLSEESWQKVARQLGEVVDPVFNQPVAEEYRRLFESITEVRAG